MSRFLTRWRRTGSVSAEKFGGYKGYALEPYKDRIVRWVTAQPDLTLSELEARLTERNRFGGAASIIGGKFSSNIPGEAMRAGKARTER